MQAEQRCAWACMHVRAGLRIKRRGEELPAVQWGSRHETNGLKIKETMASSNVLLRPKQTMFVGLWLLLKNFIARTRKKKKQHSILSRAKEVKRSLHRRRQGCWSSPACCHTHTNTVRARQGKQIHFFHLRFVLKSHQTTAWGVTSAQTLAESR